MLRLTGFYSYKGGVGRSMALAHCAVEMARRGRKVLIIDLDLEAPGQHCTSLFADQFSASRGTVRGFVDFAASYGQRMDLGLPDLQEFLVLSTTELGTKTKAPAGQILLMPAGNVRDSDAYREGLKGFDWSAALKEGAGFDLLRHLRDECRRLSFDDVLIDSRTGDADPFYVVALELADVLVVVSGYNRQNLLGTQAQLELLQSFPEARRPRKVILVFSPRPTDHDHGFWEVRVRPLAPRLPKPDLELPYDARLALAEDLLNVEADDKGAYSTGIRRLVAAIDNPNVPALNVVAATLLNPFSVIRADYASNRDLIRYFVDPGEAVTRALSDFMPVMVYGNRGTGKTTLAKHHSFETFADRLARMPIAEDLPQRIGLYLRLDIDLLNVFNVRDEALRQEFNRLFANFVDILVARKALTALNTFGGIDVWCDERRLFSRLLREFDAEPAPQQSLNFDGFQDFIEEHFSRIRRFLNNPKSAPVPVKVQGNILMKLLVESLLTDPRQRFGERWFAVIVDEAENFETYQQEVLNSRIKQIKQSDRVTYRYFLRHEGLRTRSTVADESQIIQESHDFRTLKLDEGLLADHFERHVGEIAAKQLELQPQLGSVQLSVGQRDIGNLFANLSPEQEAQRLLERNNRKDELRRWLLKHRKSVEPSFLAWFDKEPAILRRVVAVILLNQGKRPADILESFSVWDERARNWYHNYHRAGLFWLCRLYGINKVYAGLEQIFLLSGQNVRYFLEYCRAIVDEWIASPGSRTGGGTLELPIPVDVQDRAIRARAQFYLDDLRGKPRHADQMLNLVTRLGAVFAAAHASPKQSQFEINHFSIVDYDETRQTEIKGYLRECRMENVLLRRPGNKQKSLSDDRLDDWVLHPCFAPYFNISPRRKKKLDWMRSEDLAVLFGGDAAAFKALLTRFQRHYASSEIEDGDQSPEQTPLFDAGAD